MLTSGPSTKLSSREVWTLAFGATAVSFHYGVPPRYLQPSWLCVKKPSGRSWVSQLWYRIWETHFICCKECCTKRSDIALDRVCYSKGSNASSILKFSNTHICCTVLHYTQLLCSLQLLSNLILTLDRYGNYKIFVCPSSTACLFSSGQRWGYVVNGISIFATKYATVCRKVCKALKLLLCSAVPMHMGWLLLVGWLQFGQYLQLSGVQWILHGFSKNLTWSLPSHPNQMPRTNLINWAFPHTLSWTLPQAFVSTEELCLLNWACCELFLVSTFSQLSSFHTTILWMNNWQVQSFCTLDSHRSAIKTPELVPLKNILVFQNTDTQFSWTE